MGIKKRVFKCTGCGEDRPCILETNEDEDAYAFYDHTEDLKCILDPTNQTSFNWEQITPQHTNK